MSSEIQVPSTPTSSKTSKKRKTQESHVDKRSTKRKRQAEDGSQGTESTAPPPPAAMQSRQSGMRVSQDSSQSTAAVQDSQTLDQNGPSPFYIQTYAFYVPLSPIAQKIPLEGLCAEHLSPLLLTYYAPLKAVVMAYSNARVTNAPSMRKSKKDEQVMALSFNEYAVSYVWLQADLMLFKPTTGLYMEGYVNVQNEGHIGVICYNLFNASIPRDQIPSSWRWNDTSKQDGVKERHHKTHKRSSQVDDDQEEKDAEEVGHFFDDQAQRVDGLIKFRVRDVESISAHGDTAGRELIRIEGSLLTESEESSQKLRAGGGKQLGSKKKPRKYSTFRADRDGDY